MIEDYKLLYNKIYSKVNLENVLKYYNLEFRSYHARRGKEFLFCCPFHDDSTPSFSIQEKTGVYNCFVCGGGDFIQFIQNLEGFKTFKEALNYVKIQVGIDEKVDVFSVVKKSFLKSQKEDIKNEEEEKIIEIHLPKSEPAEKHFDIVKKRVCLEDIKKWGMRYCVDDKIFHERLIIPVYMNNKLVTFAARDMSGKAEIWSKVKQILKQKKLIKDDRKKLIDKYLYKKILYPFGTPMGKIFFNWDEAVKQKEVVICEGIFDALKILKFGYNALSLLSCHLNSYKAKMLIEKFETVYVALDNDDKVDVNGKKSNPGQEAAQKNIKEYLSDIQVYNVVLPVGKDPDDCLPDEFNNAISDAKKIKNIFTLGLY